MHVIRLSLLILLLAAFRSQSLIAAEPLPNILVIVADDLGWSDVGWHGGFSKTPNLDRLVREGVELDQHYVQPVCTPTRTALMSGRYPGRFGPHALAPSNLRAMPLGTVTLASALQSLGYETCQVGKWHLGSRPEWGPNQFGFDHSYGTLTGAADPWTHKYRHGPYEDTWHRDGKRVDETGNATELVAAEAVRRIQQMRRPWFAYVAFHAVHTPVDAPDKYKRLYDGVKFHDDPDETRLASATGRRGLAARRQGRRIRRRARATGQRDNTLIIFTSDNGGIESLKNAYVGDVGRLPAQQRKRPAPRPEKHTVRRRHPRLRVRQLARQAGTAQARSAHACRRLVPDNRPHRRLQARRRFALGRRQPMARPHGAATAAEPRTIYIAMKGGQAIRHGDWKLIVSDKGKPQLFNIAADPFEEKNLAATEPERLAELQKLLTDDQSKDNPTLPPDLRNHPG